MSAFSAWKAYNVKARIRPYQGVPPPLRVIPGQAQYGSPNSLRYEQNLSYIALSPNLVAIPCGPPRVSDTTPS